MYVEHEKCNGSIKVWDCSWLKSTKTIQLKRSWWRFDDLMRFMIRDYHYGDDGDQDDDDD